MKNKICIGIVLYKTPVNQFEKLVRSIIWQSCSDVEIVITLRANDNRKYIEHIGLAEKMLAGIGHIKLLGFDIGENVGFGAAHNILCQTAKNEACDLYIGANPDGMFHHNAVEELIRKKNLSSSDSLFELIQFPQEHPKIYDCFTHETDWCSGACFAIEPNFFFSIGGFDEKIFMYCEDVDLSWRVRASGGKCLVIPTALFFHDLSSNRERYDLQIQMLCSGRYLGWKWRNQEFMRVMEREMVKLGLAIEMQLLPQSALGQVPYAPEIIDKICNFHPPFMFSRARW
jgi:N-acetylglucosaminyl-diphospho-decaprenol L-rhamnosyltransferase